jgi:hypothetical protein
MKELTLIKRYHQTQERPKPPVEQRVKVMDTLDKKMQTILEKEDLSADERLKLYDQSFTRYLNVYDDYRPRSVAVAPEPMKQDLIDNEILESVPKTMKAKVQLLLKKMKNSPNISWNEKGELKYKKHESSTRFDWSRGLLEIHHSDQKNTEISQTTTESIPY